VSEVVWEEVYVKKMEFVNVSLVIQALVAVIE